MTSLCFCFGRWRHKTGTERDLQAVSRYTVRPNESTDIAKPTSITGPSRLLLLPKEILIALPNYLNDIEDYLNLGSSCRLMHEAMAAATPQQILHLAVDASRIFFRPSPHFLVMVTARELGHWARRSESNEQELALKLKHGVDGMLELALQHCGLTMNRIRELYEMRFTIINPVTDIMDKCVGTQWYNNENFWSGGVSDAYTIHAEPAISFFHLAIYGELFGPDWDAYLDGANSSVRALSVDTRLEFVKYRIPDWATIDCQTTARGVQSANGTIDPRRRADSTGPYEGHMLKVNQSNIGLTWILKSSRWRPHWQAIRDAVGGDFGELEVDWYHTEGNWRQRMWESCLVTQGVNGFEMMKGGLRDAWVPKAKELRDKIAALEREPSEINVGSTFTSEYPWLAGDLRVLVTGYVSGT